MDEVVQWLTAPIIVGLLGVITMTILRAIPAFNKFWERVNWALKFVVLVVIYGFFAGVVIYLTCQGWFPGDFTVCPGQDTMIIEWATLTIAGILAGNGTYAFLKKSGLLEQIEASTE